MNNPNFYKPGNLDGTNKNVQNNQPTLNQVNQPNFNLQNSYPHNSYPQNSYPQNSYLQNSYQGMVNSNYNIKSHKAIAHKSIRKKWPIFLGIFICCAMLIGSYFLFFRRGLIKNKDHIHELSESEVYKAMYDLGFGKDEIKETSSGITARNDNVVVTWQSSNDVTSLSTRNNLSNNSIELNKGLNSGIYDGYLHYSNRNDILYLVMDIDIKNTGEYAYGGIYYVGNTYFEIYCLDKSDKAKVKNVLKKLNYPYIQ